MSKATYPLKLPLSIKKAERRLAKEDGVSLNQWIAVAVAEKVGVIEAAAKFFKEQAAKASGMGINEISSPGAGCPSRAEPSTTLDT